MDKETKQLIKECIDENGSEQVRTTFPNQEDLAKIRARDKTCVYCGREFLTGKDRGTIEHLNHRKNWDSVGCYYRKGKPVSEIMAIACWECNCGSRKDSPLHEWFQSKYCLEKGINYQSVAQVVRDYIDKFEGVAKW